MLIKTIRSMMMYEALRYFMSDAWVLWFICDMQLTIILFQPTIPSSVTVTQKDLKSRDEAIAELKTSEKRDVAVRYAEPTNQLFIDLFNVA